MTYTVVFSVLAIVVFLSCLVYVFKPRPSILIDSLTAKYIAEGLEYKLRLSLSLKVGNRDIVIKKAVLDHIDSGGMTMINYCVKREGVNYNTGYVFKKRLKTTIIINFPMESEVKGNFVFKFVSSNDSEAVSKPFRL